jgi:hypothetical protein
MVADPFGDPPPLCLQAENQLLARTKQAKILRHVHHDVALTARAMSTVSIRMESKTCKPIISLVVLDMTASDVGP